MPALNQLTTKPHYPVLDGLRGTAALLVVIFHLFEGYFPVMSKHPIHHGYLAVDFFYLLSGFVVGYAYDDRWGKMSIAQFFKIRLIRLHPLVILGTIVGAIAFYFDPYTNGMQHATVLKLIGVMLIGFSMLPAPDIRGWGETHPLDGPCWSLMQEYIANILYAVAIRKMNKTALWVLVIISGIVLTAVAMWRGDVATGWGYDNLWIASVRMMFPFFGGLLLFRTGKLIRIPMAYVTCSIVLIILFMLPTFTHNGIYEAACIIIAFPLVVAAGAGGNIKGRWSKLCKFSGDISYPIYILHYPFIYIYTLWIAEKKPLPQNIFPIAAGLFFFFIIIGYAALKWYDEPIRAWLKTKLLARKKMGEEVVSS